MGSTQTTTAAVNENSIEIKENMVKVDFQNSNQVISNIIFKINRSLNIDDKNNINNRNQI